MLGIVLGSMALGVLIGYPFGGFMYAFFGKSTPFMLLAIAILAIFGKCCHHVVNYSLITTLTNIFLLTRSGSVT